MSYRPAGDSVNPDNKIANLKPLDPPAGDLIYLLTQFLVTKITGIKGHIQQVIQSIQLNKILSRHFIYNKIVKTYP